MSEFVVGSSVSWTHVWKNPGGSVHFSARTGRINRIHNGVATIRRSNGRRCDVLLAELDKPGEKTELTKWVESLGT